MAPQRRHIYVTNKSCHDFSDACKFGDLVFISEGPIQRTKTSVMYRYTWKALAKSRPNDFLLVTGMTIMNIIAASVMAHLHGRINLLLFDPNHKDKYLERTILLEKKNATAH